MERCRDCGKFQGVEDKNTLKKAGRMAVYLGYGFRRVERILSDVFEKHICYQTIIS